MLEQAECKVLGASIRAEFEYLDAGRSRVVVERSERDKHVEPRFAPKYTLIPLSRYSPTNANGTNSDNYLSDSMKSRIRLHRKDNKEKKQ